MSPLHRGTRRRIPTDPLLSSSQDPILSSSRDPFLSSSRLLAGIQVFLFCSSMRAGPPGTEPWIHSLNRSSIKDVEDKRRE